MGEIGVVAADGVAMGAQLRLRQEAGHSIHGKKKDGLFGGDEIQHCTWWIYSSNESGPAKKRT
jgi:hypothetical protein